MLFITARGECGNPICAKPLDITEGFEWVPEEGCVLCSKCAEQRRKIQRAMARVLKDKNDLAERIERGEVPE